jgi:potassium-transporting ATPase KdpC subunit
MWRHAAVAVKLTLLLTVLLGLAYPLAMTGIAQVIFPSQANGSIIRKDGEVIGSELIAQSFSRPGYFHPRPSAAFDPNPPKGRNARQDRWVSSGSNLGPTSKSLSDRVASDVERLVRENPGLEPGRIPVDMVTASASGLDPDISPANAYAQVPRVAKARGMTNAELARIVKSRIAERQFGILGEPRVNVLKLNRALDSMGARFQR